jgi:hypothetical protein
MKSMDIRTDAYEIKHENRYEIKHENRYDYEFIFMHSAKQQQNV